MLQFEYAQSLFGHPPHLAQVDLKPVSEAHWQQMQQAYPQTFAALRR
jgi:hypothetical protein